MASQPHILCGVVPFVVPLGLGRDITKSVIVGLIDHPLLFTSYNMIKRGENCTKIDLTKKKWNHHNNKLHERFRLYWMTACYRIAQSKAMSLSGLKRNGSSWVAWGNVLWKMCSKLATWLSALYIRFYQPWRAWILPSFMLFNHAAISGERIGGCLLFAKLVDVAIKHICMQYDLLL